MITYRNHGLPSSCLHVMATEKERREVYMIISSKCTTNNGVGGSGHSGGRAKASVRSTRLGVGRSD